MKLCNKNKKEQGDVLLEKLKALPNGLTKIENPLKALAFGEVTGSRHVIDGEVEFYKSPQGKTFIQVMASCWLKHIGGDHLDVPLDPGIYEYGIIREFDYESMEARQVRD